MSQVCDICRKPGAGLDARVLFPDLDVREHRLLDRAIHGECYSGWMYRKQFSAEFHEAARKAGRPELTLATELCTRAARLFESSRRSGRG